MSEIHRYTLMGKSAHLLAKSNDAVGGRVYMTAGIEVVKASDYDALATRLAEQAEAKMKFAEAVENMREERTALHRRLAAVEQERDEKVGTITAMEARYQDVSELYKNQVGELVLLRDALAQTRGALDKIYNHNEAARAAVIMHYGLHHAPIAALDRPTAAMKASLTATTTNGESAAKYEEAYRREVAAPAPTPGPVDVPIGAIAPLVWTRERPTVPGWYWAQTGNTDPIIMFVYLIDGELWVNLPGDGINAALSELADGYWCGPIKFPLPLPKEA